MNGLRDKTLIILMFCLMLNLVDCKKTATQPENVDRTFEEISNDLTIEAMEAADSLLTLMTLEERAGQCIMPSVFSSSDSSVISLCRKYICDFHVGGIVLLKGDSGSVKLISEIGMEAKIPLFIAIDAEWGLGMRLEDAPSYPKNGELEGISEIEMYDYGRNIAEESRGIGINMILGPVVDILSPGGSLIIGKRSFGSDPGFVSEAGVAYAKGLESGGVISVAKHFPGHGSTVIDSHKDVATVKKDISDLDSIDLRPFRDYIDSGLTGIMAGHIRSKALDPEGNPASVSMDILTHLLREEMGFKGLILTDAFDMGGAKGFSAVEAIKAGADLILCPENVEQSVEDIIKSVHEGNLPVAVLNDRCRRILFVKYLFSLFR